MNVRTRLSAFGSVWPRRWVPRVALSLAVLLLFLTAAARLRTYVLTRRVQAVLHGLSELRVDSTEEAHLLSRMPQLIRSNNDWKKDGIVQRWYYTEVSNESDRVMSWLTPNGPEWLRQLADWFGYRYMSFGARVLVQDGKVSSFAYGLSKMWVRPEPAGYIVSASSIHGVWKSYQSSGLWVTSLDDQSPQYRVRQTIFPTPTKDERGVKATFTNDAPADLTKRAFELHLTCFWGLSGCEDAREIAPELWQDALAVQKATVERLRAGRCPESIVEARMRYVPDISVLLLKVIGSRWVNVNEEGSYTQELLTDYELKEVIRGQNFGAWKDVRMGLRVPSPVDPMQTIWMRMEPVKTGSQLLFFGNPRIESCRFIPATPTAIATARNTPAPPKRPEDEVQGMLL